MIEIKSIFFFYPLYVSIACVTLVSLLFSFRDRTIFQLKELLQNLVSNQHAVVGVMQAGLAAEDLLCSQLAPNQPVTRPLGG